MTIAISGTTGITLAGQFDSASTFGFRNRIINGGMVIFQRGTSVTQGGYSVDRWEYSSTQNAKFTVGQSSTSTAGFINSLIATSSSAYSILSTDIFLVNQKIEGLNIADLAWGTANAATVTLSFWVRSSLTGTFGGSLRNSAGDRSYPFTYTISAADTFEQKTITIAGDTSGTWLTTNDVGIRVGFGLGVGSTFSGTAGAWAAGNFISATGATSVVGTSGATFYITGVQLEKGSTATTFDVRSYGTELALCQRYYEKTYNDGVALGTVTSVGQLICYVDQLPNLSSRSSTVIWLFKVSKRATPTITTYSPAVGTINTVDTSTNAVTGAVSSTGMNSTRIAVTDTVTTTASYITAHATASSEL